MWAKVRKHGLRFSVKCTGTWDPQGSDFLEEASQGKAWLQACRMGGCWNSNVYGEPHPLLPPPHTHLRCVRCGRGTLKVRFEVGRKKSIYQKVSLSATASQQERNCERVWRGLLSRGWGLPRGRGQFGRGLSL